MSTEELLTKIDLLIGGVSLYGSAQEYERVVGDVHVPTVEKHLRSTNASFAGLEGAIWEDSPGECAARIINAAYFVDGVLFQLKAFIDDDDRPASLIEQDADTVYSVLDTLTPY